MNESTIFVSFLQFDCELRNDGLEEEGTKHAPDLIEWMNY